MKSFNLALLSALAAVGTCSPIAKRAPSTYYVTLDDVVGFTPLTLFNVNPGDQIIFQIDPDSDHEIQQAIPQDYCQAVPGGLDSGIRLAGTSGGSTYVYAVPDPFPGTAVEFYDAAILSEQDECTQMGIYPGPTEPIGEKL